jgi:WhiB family redox-sensing transcriptional regulator
MVSDNSPWRSPAADRPDWRSAAACRHADPDLFFPIGTAGPALAQIDQAKRVCQDCPVRTPCLCWALDHAWALGIWGGTTEEERRMYGRRALSDDLGRQAPGGS